MPIVQPPSFEAFGLLPFQINPHYLDLVPGAPRAGETRDERIQEFLQENDVPVLGLREGAWLRRRGPGLRLEGLSSGRLFRRGHAPEDVVPGTDLSWLLETRPRFDRRSRRVRSTPRRTEFRTASLWTHGLRCGSGCSLAASAHAGQNGSA
jgi:dipeptidase E